MKTLKTLQQDYDGYRPKAGDEQKFKDKHTVKHSHKLSKAAEDDDVFKAANIKVSSREPGHGYDAGEDEDVYEEKITAKDVKMAVGVAKDKRYAGGNMTGASRVMDKIKPGLSNHPAAQKALRQANEETEQVDEGGMPSSVIKHKERIKAMSDQEFYQDHKGKSEDDLKSMARRHGYGPDNNVYVDKHKRGQQEGVAEEAEPVVKRSLGKMMEAIMNKEPVGVKIHYTHPEKKPTHVIYFTAKDAYDGEREMTGQGYKVKNGEKEMTGQGYKVKKRELVYGKAGA